MRTRGRVPALRQLTPRACGSIALGLRGFFLEVTFFFRVRGGGSLLPPYRRRRLRLLSAHVVHVRRVPPDARRPAPALDPPPWAPHPRRGPRLALSLSLPLFSLY
jgi:hypothetical protein